METINSFLAPCLQRDVELFLCEVSKRFTVDLEELQLYASKWWPINANLEWQTTSQKNKPKKKVAYSLPSNYKTCTWDLKTKKCGAKCINNYCEKHQAMNEKAQERKKKVEYKEEQTRKKAHFGLSSSLSSYLCAIGATSKPVFKVKRTNFGTYVHETDYGVQLTYDPVCKVVYGRQQPNGNIAPVTLQDVDYCVHFDILYELPENLDYEETLERKKTVERILDIVDEFDDEEDDNSGAEEE
jgi:hypothetical protein